MTLLTPEVQESPRTHAIVIGVGRYPFLKGNPRFPGMGDLDSPPQSALDIARWFLTEYANPVAPRGTLDVYISTAAGSATYADAGGTSIPIEPATKQLVTNGIEAWSKRADGSEQDVALFFFCGHGVSAGGENGLLLEDFAENDRTLFRNAIDIVGLQAGMDAIRARKQCFFVDACRNTPSAIAERVTRGGIGDPVVTGYVAHGKYGARDAPTFYSTLASQKSYGRPGKNSVFTEALLETIRRGAAYKDGLGWQIRTDRILHSLNENLRLLTRREKVPMQHAEQSEGSGFALQPLGAPPKVPVTVWCVPEAATAVADLAYTSRQGANNRRDARAPEEWTVECDVDSYEFKAEFANQSYEDYSAWEVVMPPVRDVQLPVKQRV